MHMTWRRRIIPRLLGHTMPLPPQLTMQLFVPLKASTDFTMVLILIMALVMMPKVTIIMRQATMMHIIMMCQMVRLTPMGITTQPINIERSRIIIPTLTTLMARAIIITMPLMKLKRIILTLRQTSTMIMTPLIITENVKANTLLETIFTFITGTGKTMAVMATRASSPTPTRKNEADNPLPLPFAIPTSPWMYRIITSKTVTPLMKTTTTSTTTTTATTTVRNPNRKKQKQAAPPSPSSSPESSNATAAKRPVSNSTVNASTPGCSATTVASAPIARIERSLREWEGTGPWRFGRFWGGKPRPGRGGGIWR
mmetsp:Transcript_16806/g.34966  ORF Transcript_16806/g.34966 Transcript_16806/m.34966 type:complete len:312 (+) Transcript_16806:17-952(+)